jgi:hypothetical protein
MGDDYFANYVRDSWTSSFEWMLGNKGLDGRIDLGEFGM